MSVGIHGATLDLSASSTSSSCSGSGGMSEKGSGAEGVPSSKGRTGMMFDSFSGVSGGMMKGASDDIGLSSPTRVKRSGGPSGPRIMPSALTGNSSNNNERSSSTNTTSAGG